MTFVPCTSYIGAHLAPGTEALGSGPFFCSLPLAAGRQG